MKENQCSFKIKDGRYKMYFDIYQGKDGGIYLELGTGIILLTKEQLLRVDIPYYELNDYSHDDFRKFYKLDRND